MAEFCKVCFLAIIAREYAESAVVLSEEFGLCKGCTKQKPIVLMIKEEEDSLC